MTMLSWFAILVCLSQSALLSGMNLGLFSLSKLELQVEARKGDLRAKRERDLRQVIQLHMDSAESDIAWVEGQGALNFLDIDDVPLEDEGEAIDPESILRLEFDGDHVLFPIIEPSADDLLCTALFSPGRFDLRKYCHRPIIVRDPGEKLGNLIQRFRVRPHDQGDDVLEDDVILLWSAQPRIMTASDLLGRLLRGIARPQPRS